MKKKSILMAFTRMWQNMVNYVNKKMSWEYF